MATNPEGEPDPQMDAVFNMRDMDMRGRLAWFLAGAVPGGSKRKQLARLFGVSPETAKGWLRGEAWPKLETIERMRALWGADFMRFVYAQMDELDARVARLEREMQIEDERGNALAAVADAGKAPGARPGGSGVGGSDAAQDPAVVARRNLTKAARAGKVSR